AFQVDWNGDAIGRGQTIGIKAEQSLSPGEELVDNIQYMLPHTLDNVALCDIPGLNEHMAQVLLAGVLCPTLDDTRLLLRKLACSLQDRSQTVGWAITHARVNQIPFTKRHLCNLAIVNG